MKRHRPVELNIDLGELPGEPAELYSIATTVNLACGGHAGDEGSIRRAIQAARAAGARVAAHPSYPDRAGFGRRARFSDAATLRSSVEAQCTRLHSMAVDHGVAIRTMKPHGALYHDVANDADLAAALLDAAMSALPDLERVAGPPDTAFQDIVVGRGLSFLREGFADRRYDEKLRLVPRSRPDALIIDPHACVSQALMLAKMGRIETLCVHGDTKGAVYIARAVRDALSDEGLLCPS